MVLVDTTVWVDFFAGRDQPHVKALEELIQNSENLCICGLILTEVLQGIRADTDYRKTKEYLQELILLPMQELTFIRAAETYRLLRKKGITIRSSVDCMIAAVTMENNALLLHNDRDFDEIEQHGRLKTFKL